MAGLVSRHHLPPPLLQRRRKRRHHPHPHVNSPITPKAEASPIGKAPLSFWLSSFAEGGGSAVAVAVALLLQLLFHLLCSCICRRPPKNIRHPERSAQRAVEGPR